MKPGARIAAAIEVLDSILGRHQPVATALTDWGKAHRFAGSGDRNAIGGLVYDALRRKASIAWAMDSDSTRALALAPRRGLHSISCVDDVVAACDGSAHAPVPLSEIEICGLTRDVSQAPEYTRANVPEWLWPSFLAAFGQRAADEGAAMRHRAPADVRVNTLKGRSRQQF